MPRSCGAAFTLDSCDVLGRFVGVNWNRGRVRSLPCAVSGCGRCLKLRRVRVRYIRGSAFIREAPNPLVLDQPASLDGRDRRETHHGRVTAPTRLIWIVLIFIFCRWAKFLSALKNLLYWHTRRLLHEHRKHCALHLT